MKITASAPCFSLINCTWDLTFHLPFCLLLNNGTMEMTNFVLVKITFCRKYITFNIINFIIFKSGLPQRQTSLQTLIFKMLFLIISGLQVWKIWVLPFNLHDELYIRNRFSVSLLVPILNNFKKEPKTSQSHINFFFFIIWQEKCLCINSYWVHLNHYSFIE